MPRREELRWRDLVVVALAAMLLAWMLAGGCQAALREPW